MKHFFKVFFITFACMMLTFIAGVITYNKFVDKSVVAYKEEKIENFIEKKDDQNKENNVDEVVNNEDEKKEINRSNFLLLGLKDSNADSILFVSFDKDNKKLDILLIPRNTLVNNKPISDYYKNGINDIKNKVEILLNDVKIDNYVTINIDNVIEIIDLIGGVEVDVPFDMHYEDITDNPPLVIDIKKGKQVLFGEDSIKYLRWKNNNDKSISYPDGEIGRVNAHKKFIISAIKKSLNFNLVKIAKRIFSSIDTDISNTEFFSYSTKLIGINFDDIKIDILPGNLERRDVDGNLIDYYLIDKEEVINFINTITN